VVATVQPISRAAARKRFIKQTPRNGLGLDCPRSRGR